jgi:metal-responsive CopG/Arc/MetJ family transcriptional regulator
MTEMRRVTISLPDEIDKKIIELKKQEIRQTRSRYGRNCSKQRI